MNFNIFSGARRIALVVGFIIAFITLITLTNYSPYISVKYKITHPSGPFLRDDGPCPLECVNHHFTTKTSKGKSVSIDLCLTPMPFGRNGQLLIPFKVDGEGKIWGADAFSSEISSYQLELERRFKLSKIDDQNISAEISNKYRENWFSGIGYLLVGMVTYLAIVWVIGWIVRGFLGIPRGYDHRPSTVTPAQNDGA